MIPLHRDPVFVFRFTDDRRIGRFHLEDVAPGTPVTVFALSAGTDAPGAVLAGAVAGPGGWVDLAVALVIRAGEGFIVRPEPRERP